MNGLSGWRTTARKATTAFIATGASAFAAAVVDGGFSASERWIVLGAAVGAAGLVYSVPNQGA